MNLVFQRNVMNDSTLIPDQRTNNPLDKYTLKDLLIETIREDETFKKDFLNNPKKALHDKFGYEPLENIEVSTDKDSSGILHVKLSEKNSGMKDFIHLIMLDK